MNMLVLILLFMAAFALQYLFTFLQMRGFTKAYRKCRINGYRAAIGKFSGKFHAGAIIMFGIDKEGEIHNGYVMQGVTVFARFKPFDKFNGHNIEELDALLKQNNNISFSLKKAVADADLNYQTIMRGEEVPVPPSPLQKAGNFIIDSGKQIINSIND